MDIVRRDEQYDEARSELCRKGVRIQKLESELAQKERDVAAKEAEIQMRELRQRLSDPFLGKDKLELMDLIMARLAEERSWNVKGKHVSQHTEDERVSELEAIVEEQQQQLHIQNSLLAELEELRDAVRHRDEPIAELQRGVVTTIQEQQRQLEIQGDHLKVRRHLREMGVSLTIILWFARARLHLAVISSEYYFSLVVITL